MTKIKIINNKQKHKQKNRQKKQKVNTYYTLHGRQRKKKSPTSGVIQPRQEDKDKDNECDTQRKETTKGGNTLVALIYTVQLSCLYHLSSDALYRAEKNTRGRKYSDHLTRLVVPSQTRTYVSIFMSP